MYEGEEGVTVDLTANRIEPLDNYLERLTEKQVQAIYESLPSPIEIDLHDREALVRFLRMVHMIVHWGTT